MSLSPAVRNRVIDTLQAIRNGRAVLYIFLGLFVIVSSYVIASVFLGSQIFGKAVSSAGLLLGLCAFIQLRVSGFFESLLSIMHPTDGNQCPSPKIVNRASQTMSIGLASKLRESLLANPQIGFWMGFFSSVIDLIAVWVPATI